VLTASGLESFEVEFARAHEYELDGVPVKVLPLERVIVSKRAAKRLKDAAQIPMLEAALSARNARQQE
jgi:predicted nucleotidyltransferase